MAKYQQRLVTVAGTSAAAGQLWKPQLVMCEQKTDLSDRKIPVLYIHGFTFPSSLSVFWRIKGRSWADELNDAGFTVWGLDFAGFGRSERYPSMEESGTAKGAALGPADDAVEQVSRAVQHIIEESGAPRVSIVAHSRGTIVAGLFATKHPDLVANLIFFGPIAERRLVQLPYGLPTTPADISAWRLITTSAQYERFVEDLPDKCEPKLLNSMFPAWASGYLDSDPASGERNPPSVKVPNGPLADVIEAWTGKLAYDPAGISCPLLIVRGEWDSLCTDMDARCLLGNASAAAARQDVKIKEGTHLMLFEESRTGLHRATNEFLLSN